MADYIYLIENRLSKDQKAALLSLRAIARTKGLTVFLVGGAVRDLTSGSPVRDLDVVVQGNAVKLRKDLEAAEAVVIGTNDAMQALYLRFPGGVRMELASAVTVTYPKPGKPVVKAGATILDDLRRRDFTANAMALSLNDGSYGLLMDPLNGVADIENRELRLVSNYGFIEDPVRMIRAARFSARLGWTLEEKTQGRYETGKQEGYISALAAGPKGYETEEIVHEEDPLRVMRRLEAEGWMAVLAPAWNAAKANTAELDKVRETQTQFNLQGIHPDPSAVNFPLLTAKMGAKDVDALKKSFARPGFVAEIEALEGEAKDFATLLGGKSAASASAAYRVISAAKPETVLQVAYSSKSPGLQAKFKSFFTEWPQARQKVPYVLMQEMRITADLPGYEELVEKLVFELMDGKLGTPEEMRAYLEPYSPPAPPPPVSLRRARTAKKDAKGAKGRGKKGRADLDAGDGDADAAGGDDDDLSAGGEDDDDGLEDADEMEGISELVGEIARDRNDEMEEDEVEEEAPPSPAARRKQEEADATPEPEVEKPAQAASAESTGSGASRGQSCGEEGGGGCSGCGEEGDAGGEARDGEGGRGAGQSGRCKGCAGEGCRSGEGGCEEGSCGGFDACESGEEALRRRTAGRILRSKRRR